MTDSSGLPKSLRISPAIGVIPPRNGVLAATPSEMATTISPVKRGRGRPKGSKNRRKSNGRVPPAKKRRIAGGRKSTAGRKKKSTLTMKSVDAILEAHGVANLSKVCTCLKAGILRGHIKLLKPADDPAGEFGLDQVVAEGECFMDCGETLVCTIRDILYQADYGGDCYETGGESATFHCKTEDCPGIYVSGLCEGEPQFDSGKFHNHCRACPGFGSCIGDYREVHCMRCGDHYHGLGGCGECYNCSPNSSPIDL